MSFRASPDTPPKTVLTLRLDEDQLRGLRERAERNERTVSAELRLAVRRHLAEDEREAA